ncbi:hypothetical protein BC829DRAFT_430384 [Chytridium lagenaria]|nr:hypothetical protein BC829DRAFT_430384 [Chytridium lagenaria]
MTPLQHPPPQHAEEELRRGEGAGWKGFAEQSEGVEDGMGEGHGGGGGLIADHGEGDKETEETEDVEGFSEAQVGDWQRHLKRWSGRVVRRWIWRGGGGVWVGEGREGWFGDAGGVQNDEALMRVVVVVVAAVEHWLVEYVEVCWWWDVWLGKSWSVVYKWERMGIIPSLGIRRHLHHNRMHHLFFVDTSHAHPSSSSLLIQHGHHDFKGKDFDGVVGGDIKGDRGRFGMTWLREFKKAQVFKEHKDIFKGAMHGQSNNIDIHQHPSIDPWIDKME